MSDQSLRMILDNLHDTASLTATSERSSAGVENTQRNERNRVWRSVDTATQVVEGTLSVGAYVDCLAIIDHNLTAAGSLRIELLSGETVVHDSGPLATAEIIPVGAWRVGIDPYGATYNDKLAVTITVIETPLVAITRYRLTLEDAGNPDGGMQIARIALGMAFQPTFNMSWGAQSDWVDKATHEDSAGQTLRTINGGRPRRQVQFSLDWLQPGDRARLVEELAQRGMMADVFVDLYPHLAGLDRLAACFVGRLASGYGDTHTHPRNRKSTLTITEV
ncbi:hypothetical protein QO259_17050 [Salinicola sp. JS01]|uniref:hypothetical protein n=1 Tax=Salinicola sp. JS01 TaxID=3050071 RepID=UPI00255BDA27|nr:hypothetical protein [Salinicola sp. JS01]WIX32496.1 hypothetical protein QO259_17050 [Salinicola sp. JS01]